MGIPIVDMTVAASAAEFQVEPEEVMGRSRLRPVVYARHAACWVIRRRSTLSFPQIGRALDRDHTSVMNAVRCVDRSRDPVLREGARRVLTAVDAKHPRRAHVHHARLDVVTATDLHDRITNDYSYHPPSSPEIAEAHERVREILATAAHGLVDICPESRELSLALTKLEEAMFFANGVIARTQTLR